MKCVAINDYSDDYGADVTVSVAGYGQPDARGDGSDMFEIPWVCVRLWGLLPAFQWACKRNGYRCDSIDLDGTSILTKVA